MKPFISPDNKFMSPSTDYYANKASVNHNRHGRDQACDLITITGSVIDVGAHMGLTTLFWLEKGFDHVYAFEINSNHYDCLLSNTQEQKEKITYYPYGCSNAARTAVGSYQSRKNSGSFQILDDHVIDKIDSNNKFPIELKRIDDFEYESVSLIKIDVQGWEFEVLCGAVNTIKKHQPLLYVEYLGGAHAKSMHTYNNQNYLDLIEEIGYKAIAQVPDTIYLPK